MQLNDQYDSQQQQNLQQQDIYSYPLPIRIKHPSWSIRKGTYQQLLYYLKNISSPTEQILISGSSYTLETLLPYFQNLVQEKHAVVLLKGMQCVESILLLEKKAASKHCIKTLIDKGIEYFPLLSQQRKAILQKFLDILELSKIDGAFLKNKLNLPHQKSVMYVIEVIAVLNITSLKGVLIQLSKKHQKKCVRQLAAQIAQQMQQSQYQNQQQTQPQIQQKSKKSPAQSKSQKPQQSTNCKLTIQKLPHYEQLASKKQQQYSTQLLQKIEAIIEEYTMAQLPNFSHILRLMIDDNNHIININAIKCLVAIFNKQRENSLNNKPSLVPASFPLLFIFNKFKSHKTHPINSLMLSLTEAILQSTPNRLTDLILAINQGLTSAGSKANVKFGCALTFFRILSLLYQNQDLYACTTNENIQNQNQDLQQKFNIFSDIKLGKNQLKVVEKIMTILDKDKKYQTEMYLIKYAIGMDVGNVVSSKDVNVMSNKSSVSTVKQFQLTKNSKQSDNTNTNVRKASVNLQPNSKKTPTLTAKQKNESTIKSPSLTQTLKQSKSSVKFQQINLQTTLNTIIKSLSQHNQKQQRANFTTIQKLLQKSSQQFYQCVRQRRYEMFYLCQLLQHFIQNYEPTDSTIEHVSEYLINLLKIISLLKPLSITSPQFKEISFHNVSQLLLVALCKLVISEQIQEVLENLSQNYGFEVIYESLQNLFVKNRNNKMKKKNKKFLLQWLEGNTPALFLNDDYYRLIEFINQKEQKVKSKQIIETKEISDNKEVSETKEIMNSKQTSEYGKNLNKVVDKQKSQKNRQTINQLQSSSFRRRQVFEQLQSINLSKIENNHTQSNDFCEDMQKSSFHHNLEQNLRQIKTNRSYQEETFNDDRNYEDMSREYLRNLRQQQFKKKETRENKILESSPFREEKYNNYQQSAQGKEQKGRQEYQMDKYDSKQGQVGDKIQYDSKFQQVQRRRLQRQRERRQFMNRMKQEYKPMMGREEQQSEEQGDDSQQEQVEDKRDNNQQEEIREINRIKRESPRRNRYQREVKQEYQDKQYPEHSQVEINQEQEYNHQPNQHQTQQYSQQYNHTTNNNLITHQQNLNANYSTQINSPPLTKKQPTKTSQQAQECSFVSSTSSGQFKYRLLNQEKITYMLKTTTNPYPHLRTLILIPFKSSHNKHQFLKQLIHFFNNFIEFTLPQPYTSLALLTILMFSEIKQDKTLIQPLQSLYEQVAKHSTTNDFIKTIISLFHTVIEQTLQQNRKFLITILLKSMIRMLPFIEDGLSLLRDIQQFYQIGEMVYFQMFQEEYTQIRSYMQEEAIDIIVEKALQQQGQNLKSIVEGWLNTQWKNKVAATINEYSHQHSHQQLTNQQSHNYQSYI